MAGPTWSKAFKFPPEDQLGAEMTAELTGPKFSPSTNRILDDSFPRDEVDLRRIGRLFGWLFLGTFITSIPARLLFIHGVGASWSNMHLVAGKTSTAS